MRRAPNEFEVLLTYPAENFRVFDSMIPLGIASIGAIIEEKGYKVKIIDFNHYKGDFKRDLKTWNPKIIGIGGTTATRMGSFKIARLAKEVLPGVPVVYGGPHATFTTQDTLINITEVDYIVKGEGEFAFLSLVDNFVGTKELKIETIAGLCYRKNDAIIENKQIRIDDLDMLPPPARHLFDHDYRMTMEFYDLEADFLMTSRGCPASCTFCAASQMFPGGVRVRSMQSIKEEIETILSRKKIKALKIFDSTFSSKREHVLEFCKMIEPYHLLWECEVRADTVDHSLLYAMKMSGCRYINIGLETSNDRLLKSIAKNIKVTQVETCLRWCKELGIKTKVFFIFGHLDQSIEECRNDVRYISRKKDEIDFFSITIGVRVYPGTPLETQLKRRQIITSDFSWAKYKPPFRNRILFEFGNVLILEQENLTIFNLFKIMLMLITQRTTPPWSYLLRMSWQSIILLFSRIWSLMRTAGHSIVRLFRG